MKLLLVAIVLSCTVCCLLDLSEASSTIRLVSNNRSAGGRGRSSSSRRRGRQQTLSTVIPLASTGAGTAILQPAIQPVTIAAATAPAATQFVRILEQPQPALQRVQIVQQQPQAIALTSIPAPVAPRAIRIDTGDGSQDSYAPPKYNYRYEVVAPDYLNYHAAQEERDGNLVRGSYSVLLPTGEIQTVTYYADETGYHPTITVTPGGAQSLFGAQP